jgi:hypothetical protein
MSVCAALAKKDRIRINRPMLSKSRIRRGQIAPLFFSSRLIGWHHRWGAVGTRIVLAGGMAGPVRVTGHS